jgi:hypothetical protein
MLLTSFPEVYASNLGWRTEYSESGCSWFFSVFQAKFWDIISLLNINRFQFTNLPNIQRYVYALAAP